MLYGKLNTASGQAYCMVKVSDNGVGMNKAIRKCAFEPFFATKSDQGGTGLGLATAYRVVQEHGRMIVLESEVSVGTTVNLILPVAIDASYSAR